MPFRLMHDSRSIKTINVLSSYCKVDVFYPDFDPNDINYFNSNTRLFGIKKRNDFVKKLQNHSFFYDIYNSAVKTIVSTGVKYDYIWVHDLPVLKPAIKLKKKIGSKVIYDCHEIYIETLNQFFPEKMYGIKKIILGGILKLMIWLGRKAEKRLVKDVDTCITVGKYVKEYLELQFSRSDIKIIYNCPYIQSSNEKVNLRNQLGLFPENRLIIYQGVMNPGRALEQIIKAQKYTFDYVKLIMMGDGTLKKQLMELTKKEGLDNKIFFINRVPSSELLKYTRSVDAGIILQDVNKNLSKKYGIANKFFEYIHAGIPFVATDAPENRIIYNQYPVCELIDPINDVKQIAQAINLLFSEPIDKFKNQAIEATKVYNWDNQVEIIKSIIV